MLTRVALATHRSVLALVDEPLHEVVAEFALIDEAEAKAALVRRKESLDLAVHVAYAFHDGKKLERELREFAAELRTPPGHLRERAVTLTPDVMARVNAILAADGRAAMAPAQPAEVS